MNDEAPSAPSPDPAVLSPILRRHSSVLRAESVELRQRMRFLRRRVRHQFARSNDLLTVSRFQRHTETAPIYNGPQLVRQARSER